MNEKTSRRTFRERLHHMVQSLRNDIINGVYQPGDYLPSESKLVELFNLSNKSVRKGLDQLVEQKLIVKKNRIGSMVTNVAQNTMVNLHLGCSPSIMRDFKLEMILDLFHEKYPTIQVNPVNLKDENYVGTIEQYLNNGLVDLVTMNGIDFMGFDERDHLSLLEPLEDNEEIYSFLIDDFTKNETQFVRPIIFSPVVLCYNKSHFEQLNLSEPDSSWTWDDFIKHAEIISKERNNHGMHYYVLSDNRWPLFLAQSGIKYNVLANDVPTEVPEKWIENLKKCKEIYNHDAFPKYLSENSGDANYLFLMENVSMILITYPSLNDLIHSELSYDISPVPFMEMPLTLTMSIGLAVNRNSEQKEAAKLFVDFCSSTEIQSMIGRHTLSIPAHKAVAEMMMDKNEHVDEVNRPSRFALFREILPALRSHRQLGLRSDQFAPFRNILKLFLSGLLDEAQFRQQLNEQFKKHVNKREQIRG